MAPLSLQKYVPTFVENGVEDLETILELQEEHLEMMKIPLGHKLKIMKQIKTCRPPEEEVKEAPRPKMAEAGTQDDQPMPSSLMEGMYDEAEQQR